MSVICITLNANMAHTCGMGRHWGKFLSALKLLLVQVMMIAFQYFSSYWRQLLAPSAFGCCSLLQTWVREKFLKRHTDECSILSLIFVLMQCASGGPIFDAKGRCDRTSWIHEVSSRQGKLRLFLYSDIGGSSDDPCAAGYDLPPPKQPFTSRPVDVLSNSRSIVKSLCSR